LNLPDTLVNMDDPCAQRMGGVD